MGPRVLSAELIEGETNHREVVVGLVKGLNACVLWRSATGAGDIDDHPTGSAKVSKRGVSPFMVVKGISMGLAMVHFWGR